MAGDSRTFADLLSANGLEFVNDYADGISPWKPYLVITVADGVERSGDSTLSINDRCVDGSTGVIELAHSLGLLVHTFTFGNDASGYGFADPQAEMAYYFGRGVDGLFTDFPDTGVVALAQVVPLPGAASLLAPALLGLAARRRCVIPTGLIAAASAAAVAPRRISRPAAKHNPRRDRPIDRRLRRV